MADKTTKETIVAVYNTLKNSATLSYVKSWHIGSLNTTRIVFPYIGVGNASFNVEPITHGARGKDQRTYTMTIYCATRDMAADVAYLGDVTHKGILDIIEDIMSVIRVSDFGVFYAPANVTNVKTDAIDDQQMLFGAAIDIEGKAWDFRNK